MEEKKDTGIDKEWEKLMEEAWEIGLTPEDIRLFLQERT